jgi:hypothetical protein
MNGAQMMQTQNKRHGLVLEREVPVALVFGDESERSWKRPGIEQEFETLTANSTLMTMTMMIMKRTFLAKS